MIIYLSCLVFVSGLNQIYDGGNLSGVGTEASPPSSVTLGCADLTWRGGPDELLLIFSKEGQY